jgi:predicted porin
MQKKIIALAIAGLVSGGAFAQASTVTISGQMRLAIDNASAGGCSAVGCTNITSRTRVTDQNSNIRFAGVEPLGGGTDAWWQAESAIGTNNNVGTTGGNAPGAATSTGVGTRNTALGLKGAWGSAFAGKWDVHYATMAAIDINGLAQGLAISTNSINMTQTINGVAVTGSGRDNNVVAYVTPDFSGFKAVIGYTFITEQTTPGLNAKDAGWTLNPSYTNGPIALAWSYLNVKNAGVGTAAGALGVDVRSNKIGGAYTFPMGFKFGLIWDKSRLTNDATAALGVSTMGALTNGNSIERSSWTMPVSYRMGPHNFSYTYGHAGNVSSGQAGFNGSSTGAKMNMLGYEYSMSKRTTVGLSWVGINNDSNGNYDGWHPSSNVGGSSATGLPVGSDPRIFSLNLSHTF